MPHKLCVHRVALFVATALLALAALPAHAKRAPERDAASAALLARSAPEARIEGLTRGRLESGVQRQYGLDSGVLRRYWLRDLDSQPSSTMSPKDVASKFLADHARELGVNAGRIEETLALAYQKESPSGTHLRWNQVVNGVPVFRSEIVIKVNKRGQVSSVMNNLQPELTLATTPALSADDALERAVAWVAPTGPKLGDFKAELSVVMQDRTPRLAWIASVPVQKPMGDWRVFVDAKTGDVIGVSDEIRHANGTGYVFDPDPRSKMGDSTYLDQNDADAAVPFPGAYDLVTLQGITFNGSVYSLDGPYARLIDNEAPTVAPVTPAHPDSFRFQRNAQGFEDVMVYFHLDASQRYIQSLGFTNVNNRVQQVDSHGLNGDDNSHYVPSTGNLAFGEGGVDDDEDVDVIWHEYGHSIQDNIVPGWGGGQESQMGEGFGDYWGGSYSLSKFPGFQPLHFFTWDGNGESWAGRRLIDTAKHYPEDCCGQVHASGTLWCSGLTDCWFSLGRTVMDRLVLDHHFALGTSATMADAANQIIQSDIDLYGGAHIGTLVTKFGFWGFVNPNDFIPSITHTPLTDAENTSGPYTVSAVVTSTQPLTANSPMLFWGYGASITDSVQMTPAGPVNTFQANIPGPGFATDIRYYIRAADTNGGVAFHPTTAPATPHVFHVGADVTPPTLTHTALGNQPKLTWPASVSATVTDNLGVASVVVDWTLNSVPRTPFNLVRVGSSNVFTAAFNSINADVNPGDVVTYHVTATDAASTPNTSRSPASGEHSFTITAALGVVLVLDDDEVAKRSGTKLVVDKQGARTLKANGDDVGISSANAIAGILNTLGYVASVEPANTSNPATWPTYSFIVSASGSNTAPVANATFRASLESYVAAGGKLLIEGGEVGYDASSSPIYPSFRDNVLHVTTWQADNAGALNRRAAQASHPIATTPNALPATLPIAYVSFGNEDAMVPAASAAVIYETANRVGDAGVLAYDNNVAPQAGQIVFFAFDLKVMGDATLRSQLVQNSAAYLLASELAPDASVSGRVSLGTNNNGAGATVTLSPGGASTTTDAAGLYSITGLYPGTYTVTASKTGYQSASASGVVLNAASETGNVNLHLFPQLATSVCRSPGLAIPDNTPAGIADTMAVAETFAVKGVTVSVNIPHTYIGDLVVELRHGAKTTRLHNLTGGSAENIVGTYPTTLPVDGPGSLNDHLNDPANGNWILFLSDNANIDVGTLTQWCLNIAGPVDSGAVVGVEPGAGVPNELTFAPVAPNPIKAGGATLRFTTPREGRASLAIFDVTGRRVATVVDGNLPAGVHLARWNGRDDQGRTLSPGIYMARVQYGADVRMQRIAVVH